MTKLSLVLKLWAGALMLTMLGAQGLWPSFAWPIGIVAGFGGGFIAFGSNRLTAASYNERSPPAVKREGQ